METEPLGEIYPDFGKDRLICTTQRGIWKHAILNFYFSVITTLRPMQNPTGGFGGGHGQISHIAGSYAAVLSLAMVGGEEAFGLVDRHAM